MRTLLAVCAALLSSTAVAQAEPDRDGDGLSDFQEVHKYFTNPDSADSDGDGVRDGDWRERREFQYTVRTVVHVLRPVTIEWLCDDHQDARVLDETPEHVELEVIHYPFTTVAASIAADPQWRRTTAAMTRWLAPGVTADWTPAMRDEISAAMRAGGVDLDAVDDKTLVERAASWLCGRTTPNTAFTTFVTAFDAAGKPFVPAPLHAGLGTDLETFARDWPHDLFASGMLASKRRGTCTSTAIYLNGCLRALSVPTRVVLCIPAVDANDEREIELVERGLTHARLRATALAHLRPLKGWTSHTFNEVFVGGRWRRLDERHLGRDIAGAPFGLMTHVATFDDWADARAADTIGKRQQRSRHADVFGGRNPYSTIALRDEFGPHCELERFASPPVTATVTAVHWGTDEALPDDVRTWFRDRGVFGLAVTVVGPRTMEEMHELFGSADLGVQLAEEGKAPLDLEILEGVWWGKDEHWIVVVKVQADVRERLGEASVYRFEPRNRGREAWRVAPAVSVRASPR